MLKFFNKPWIYLVMGTENVQGKDPLLVLEQALISGITHFQLREKGPSALRGEALTKFAQECKQLCRQYRVPFIVNDDVNLALEVDADGVHVGQEDAEAGIVRRMIGKDKILGVSVHSVEEAKSAVENGADYVGMGPVFGTQSKADAKPPAGVTGILAVKKIYPSLAVVGIGGITPENAGEVWRAGGNGVAVISSITHADDIQEQVRRFIETSKGGVLK